ncbi:MAG: hypothetical protein RML40_03405 [Bacteroidota bacterium]|nr:hypothetical protein [Candidatus Kapabacteria bacterium]MDW8219558.1 hypothetical protein [Bacteroidota bacterium]
MGCTAQYYIAEDRSSDPTVAADSRGNVVVIGATRKSYVTNSVDGGATFSTPKNVGGGLFARVIGNELGFLRLRGNAFLGIVFSMMLLSKQVLSIPLIMGGRFHGIPQFLHKALSLV